ncbi:circumsporozoite protein isoform X1 [Colletes gigas]|uniref:circumsporozoite protein isoform X1 n=1 Tax=Colletes gigas TaxID=935657 RepID=UPI001C9A91C4|nr:circumsporozoite protein isoform X1 [Colletes gigas]
MLCDKVVSVFVLCLAVLVNGMPQNNENGNQDASAAPPLIQFTNGGIRFNLGGYHAEAGLGGLLTGSKTGGGLHASAGTPWGAQAGAGLGGLLGGDNGNAGGGLYARAGLGNGRPQAAAGLGGMLDGSARSNRARGGLFAGATTGVRGVGVAAGTGNDGPSGVPPSPGSGYPEPSNPGPSNAGVSGGGRTNIQIIAKKPGNLKQAPNDANNAGPPEKDQPSNKEIREAGPQPLPIAKAGIYGTISVSPVPQTLVPQQVDQVKVIETIEPAPPAPPLTSEVNEIVQVVNRPQRVRVVYPKWIVRKRLWGPRKQIIYDASAEAQNPPEQIAQKITRRQADRYVVNTPTTETKTVVAQGSSSDGFFDDVFNIPVSTLNAVNQLLNNNFG